MICRDVPAGGKGYDQILAMFLEDGVLPVIKPGGKLHVLTSVKELHHLRCTCCGRDFFKAETKEEVWLRLFGEGVATYCVECHLEMIEREQCSEFKIERSIPCEVSHRSHKRLHRQSERLRRWNFRLILRNRGNDGRYVLGSRKTALVRSTTARRG